MGFTNWEMNMNYNIEMLYFTFNVKWAEIISMHMVT
jgi:hypothetical protein